MNQKFIIIFATLASLGATNRTMAQENSRIESIKKTLQGQAESPPIPSAESPTGVPSTAAGPRKRGLTTRGALKKPAVPLPRQVETRTLYVSRGGVRGASPQQAFFGDAPARVTEVMAPEVNPNHKAKGDLGVPAGAAAYKVEYKVDPTSQLKGEVLFEKGNAEIRTGTGSMAFLSDLATALKDPVLKDHKFVIEGHASADGNAVTNKYLSQERANKIRDLLVVEFGVNSNQVFPAGYGEDEARFSEGAPEASLELDRRVLVYKLEE